MPHIIGLPSGHGAAHDRPAAACNQTGRERDDRTVRRQTQYPYNIDPCDSACPDQRTHSKPLAAGAYRLPVARAVPLYAGRCPLYQDRQYAVRWNARLPVLVLGSANAPPLPQAMPSRARILGAAAGQASLLLLA